MQIFLRQSILFLALDEIKRESRIANPLINHAEGKNETNEKKKEKKRESHHLRGAHYAKRSERSWFELI